MATGLVTPTNYVVNECLSYVQFYRDSSANDNLKNVVVNFFVGDEIALAKGVLWANCKELGDKPVRRDSSTRTQISADTTDILDAFKKIDENNIKIPTFVAVTLNRLPRHGPEEINIFSLADRLSIVEREMTAMKKDVNDKITAHQNTLYSSAAAHMPPSRPLSAPGHQAPTHSTHHPKGAQLPASKLPPQPVHGGTSADRDGFVTINRRQRKPRTVVVGTKKSDVFHGCRPRANLFVSRVPKEYPVQHIKDMIADTGAEILDVQKLSHPDAAMSSYKVTVWRDDEAKLLLPTSWPEFITCRRYFRPRKQQQQQQQPRNRYDEWNEENEDWGTPDES